jgi:DNA-binding response OmpR family regulator
MSKIAILVAEDERHTRDAISLVLENAGYKVFQADTGRRAVAMIDDFRATMTPIDLLILDIEMSGLTGIQVLESARSQGDMIPVVLITGLTRREIPARLQAEGYIEVLPKPFDPEQLINAVSRALGNRAGTQQKR